MVYLYRGYIPALTFTQRNVVCNICVYLVYTFLLPQPVHFIKECGFVVFIRLRTEVSNHVEPVESPDSDVSVSRSDNRKRKSEDMLQTSRAKYSKSESSEFTPPPMIPLHTRANNITTALLSNRPYCLVVATPRSEILNRWGWHNCQELNCGLISNNPNDRAEYYLNHIVCPYRPTG